MTRSGSGVGAFNGYPKPRMNFASSDIRSGVHGGSKVNSTSTASTPGNAATASPAPLRDGAHDFDFLIGDWKAHVRRLPERLTGSNNWIDYDGISRHKKILDSNANSRLNE